MRATAVASTVLPNRPRRFRAGPLWASLHLFFLLLLVAPWATAGEAEGPGKRPILTVKGAVDREGGSVSFTRDQLEALGTVELKTTTPFTEGEVRFTGVPLEALLQAVGARGDQVRATALNDYKVDIPRADAKQYDVLLATRIDGKPLPIRDKGPIWVIYPWSRHPELRNPVYGSRSIWQVRSLEVR